MNALNAKSLLSCYLFAFVLITSNNNLKRLLLTVHFLNYAILMTADL